MKKIINTLLITGAIFSFGAFFVPTAFATNPTLVTGVQTGLTQTQVTLNGSFIANGATSIDVWFDYDTSPLLSQSTTHQTFSVQNGTFSATISVTPGQQYYYRAMGIVSGGFGYGSTVSFTAPGYTLPTVTTGSAQPSSTTATLNGYFNSNGSSTQTRFEYANNQSMVGSVFTPYVTQNISSGNFSYSISGLSNNTTYYFRARAKNSAGEAIASSIVPFTTTSSGGGSSCTITSFVAGPSTVTSGSSSTLSWTTQNCTSATLTLLGSQSVNGSVSTGALSNTTTYTLTATGSSTTDTETVTITVTGGNSGDCTITSLYATPSMVNSGSGSTIYWTTSGCTSTNISGGSISGSYGTNGSVYTGALYSTTTYSLTAYGTNTTTSSITVGISNSQNTCYITSFYASPSTVSSGSGTTLYWNTTGCTSVYISGTNLNNSYSTVGSTYTGAIYNTTNYTLTAYGSNTQTSTVTVGISTLPNPWPQSYACSDGIDNDGDGKIDLYDLGCTSGTDQDEYNYIAPPGPGTTYACSDGIDNDLDGKIDYPSDPGCISTLDSSEYNLVIGQTVEDVFGQGSLSINSQTGRPYYNRNNLAGLALFGYDFTPGALVTWILLIVLVILIIIWKRRDYTSTPRH